jgi:2-dehydro-3-deoxyphosphooctonate aldolase (KDO 8-P synthase)
MSHIVNVGKIAIGDGNPLVLIAGPCVIETHDAAFETAAFLKDVTDELQIPFIFKTS